MTIASQISKSGPFACNGVTTVFPGGFALIDAGHVSVILTNPAGAETVLTLGTHYSVSGVGGPTFSVTLSPARPAGYSVTLIRNVPFTQETDLESQGAYFAEVVEAAFDAAVARDQQLKELIDRSVKIPASADIADLDSLVADIVQLGDRTEAIEAVAAIAPNVTTVAGVAGAVTTVAGIAPAVSSVGAASAQVSAVAANLSTISAVAANATNINAASGHAASASASATAASASALAAAASAATTTPVPVQINAATDTAFADADMLPARKTSDGSLIKRSWGNVKTALSSLFVSHSSPQALTAAQAGQARANIGADVLGGYRNKIINGDFEIWQRGVTIAPSFSGSYLSDRWTVLYDGTGSTRSITRQTHTVGQTDVPGNPTYFLRYDQSVAGTGAGFNVLSQRIEGVRSLAGKTATVTFYAKSPFSNPIRQIYLIQHFGTSGSPSANVDIPVQVSTIPIATTWQKVQFTVVVPSITGKTIGTNGNDQIRLDIYFQNNTTFVLDFSHVSVVEGDATAEADPFSPRHLQQELALCQRYYCKSFAPSIAPSPNLGSGNGELRFQSAVTGGGQIISQTMSYPTPMRTTPTMALFNPGAANSQARNLTDGADCSVTTVVPQATGFTVGCAGNATASPGDLIAICWTADAEI